jgi:hypothetical protein
MIDGQLEAARRDPGRIDPDVYLYERYRETASRRTALNAYYAIKPLLPRRAQIAARRLHAKHVRPAFPDWPIEPLLVEHQHAQWQRELSEQSVERLPLVNFWPDAHRFAVTVTHDVESAAGVANIEAVLEVERRYGVISCWNFVAEWYPIPPGTFELVRDGGGEVGLHGVKHDGLLFRDRASFEGRLPAIQRYLREWGAVGFRSPATHRNAEWMGELGCLYDSSFPDTDPFEPQPGGCCSIFPYFLGPIVELPITMTQDHTLWEILRQPNIDLWRQKGDWLISNHGLVNVIVHPDYVRSAARLDLYAQFLSYLRERVDGRGGWHALPCDVASWWRARAQMRCTDEHAGPRIVHDETAGQWSQRATVAWVSERDGTMKIDV